MSDTAANTATAPVATTATTAPAVGDTSTPAPVAQEKPDANLALRVAALTKKEVAAVKARQAADSRLSEIATREAALQAREARLQEFETLKTANPKKALEYAGISYEDLTKIQMNGGEVPPELEVRKVKADFDAYVKAQEDKVAAAAKTADETRAAAEAQAINQFKQQIADHVSDAKSYSRYPKLPSCTRIGCATMRQKRRNS
jgi:hypothetical protein